MSGPDANFLFQQKVWDAFRDAYEFLRKNELVIAVHPDDLTDEMRRMIEAAPLTTLRESKFVKRGTLYMIRPGLLGDLSGAHTASTRAAAPPPEVGPSGGSSDG